MGPLLASSATASRPTSALIPSLAQSDDNNGTSVITNVANLTSGQARISPRRRENVPQPPILTTSLSGLQYQGGGLPSAPTPSSALSSPFSQTNPSAFPSSYSPSPTGAQRGTSPMAARLSGAYTTTYNPREWGAVTNSPQAGGVPFPQTNPNVRQPHGSDDVAPPPYSPKRNVSENRTSQNLVTLPAETISQRQSQYVPSVSAIATTTGSIETAYAAQNRQGRYSSSSSLPPPPPPKASSRSSSSNPAGRPNDSRPASSIQTGGVLHFAPETASVQSGSRLELDGSSTRGSSVYNSGEDFCIPPSSKRAVSASAIGLGGVSSRTSNRSGSSSPARQSTWEPGRPLPGPPPGPPPAASRSQSAGGSSDKFTRQTLAPGIRRQAPQLGTALGPVPPTPAGWFDSSRTDRDSATDSPYNAGSLTFSPVDIASTGTMSSCYSDAGNPFAPASASRDPSAKGIRERRSESRGSHVSRVTDENLTHVNTNPWADSLKNVVPADLALATGGGVLGRKRTITKSSGRTPRSSRSTTLEEQPFSATSEDLSTNPSSASSRMTPRPDALSHRASASNSIDTPPFSPDESQPSGRPKASPSTTISPKALPTPPLQQHSRSPMSIMIPPSNLQIRPISHILHMPNESTGSISAPLSPRRPPHSRSGSASASLADQNTFIRECFDRTKAFLEKEQNADSDEERLRLFSDHILTESRIRRRRYATVFGSFDARPTRDRLFELNMHAPRRSSGLQETTIASPIEPKSPMPRDSPLQGSESGQGRPDTLWSNGYQPQLSPIASMSMNDEESSRGRAPSRWWESQTGSDVGGGGRRVERSKRESKYMGLPLRAVQQAMDEQAWTEPGASQFAYGPNEYPPEKVGGYETGEVTPGLPPPVSPRTALDVSRLVTLPPPYPRHYPAVQNQHPDLVSYRTLVRTVGNLDEPNSRKGRYKSTIEALQKDSLERTVANRRNFRVNIQAQIQEGSLSYAEAAEAEAAMKTEELAAEKSLVQAAFDSFQDVVVNPVHNLLGDRIAKTTQSINELHRKLLGDAQLHNPNETQSAGDERPELLEQLTLLKWLFEAREQLHREDFDLMTERNKKYQAIVTLPYQQGGPAKEEKVRETTAFFAKDNQDRIIAFENESLKRHHHFLGIIEDNVLRGVEAQLSAFWDIAPGLLAVCQKIPDSKPTNPSPDENINSTAQHRPNTRWQGIQIPREEMEENTSYAAHPMQYLYSLLRHAERSAYQFIESQINLMCLLHEARSGAMAEKVKCWEVGSLAEVAEPLPIPTKTPTTATSIKTPTPLQTPTLPITPLASPARVSLSPIRTTPAVEAVLAQSRDRRAREEQILTVELKDRVATVEGQWTEALGSAIAGVRERVRGWLVEEGGWDGEMEMLD